MFAVSIQCGLHDDVGLAQQDGQDTICAEMRATIAAPSLAVAGSQGDTAFAPSLPMLARATRHAGAQAI